jgi:hypothetical protein
VCCRVCPQASPLGCSAHPKSAVARVVCPRVALVRVWQEDGLRHRSVIGSRASTLQPDLGAPCRRTDADLRGLHLFEASRSNQRLFRTVSTAVGSANLIRVHPLRQCPRLLVVAAASSGSHGIRISRPVVPCRTDTQESDRRTRCCKGGQDDSAMRHEAGLPPRHTISQALTSKYAIMVKTRGEVVPGCFDSPEL